VGRSRVRLPASGIVALCGFVAGNARPDPIAEEKFKTPDRRRCRAISTTSARIDICESKDGPGGWERSDFPRDRPRLTLIRV